MPTRFGKCVRQLARSNTCCFLVAVCYFYAVGAWLSLVERTVRDREVGGSNPLAPTIPFRRAIRIIPLARYAVQRRMALIRSAVVGWE